MTFTVSILYPADGGDEMVTEEFSGIVDLMNLPSQGVKFIYDDDTKHFPGGEILRVQSDDLD